jgi:hypothetical protein
MPRQQTRRHLIKPRVINLWHKFNYFFNLLKKLKKLLKMKILIFGHLEGRILNKGPLDH